MQRRKVKSIINEVDYFHALESLKLAQEIQKRAAKTIACFVEVNISGEASKQGIAPDDVVSFIEELQPFDKINVIGLMTMAPLASSEAEQPQLFSSVERITRKNRSAALGTCSMYRNKYGNE